MKKLFALVLISLFIINLNFVSSDSIDNEFKKLANYAGEYESGNINYVQLLIYTSSIRENMNEILGASREIGGVLKQEQIKKILGEPIEETKWVWVEGEEREMRLDNAVPVWKKIVFDGRKIQIRLNAWPSIFSKREFKEEVENEDERNKELGDLEGKIIYRLNFDIEFKKPEEQLNIEGKISEIQTLAQIFNSEPVEGNAEILAKESVNAERAFQSYLGQSGGKCEDIMNNIFGTENKRQTQKLLVQEISFCDGDNFEVIARLEMCDECEGNWINLDFWIQGRGPGFNPQEEEMNRVSPENFRNMNSVAFEGEVRGIINGMKQSCDNRDFNSIMNAKNKLQPLNEAWNQKSNDVWKEIDESFRSQVESMTQEQRQEFDQNYGWIKQEQEKRQKVKELQKQNYETRKQFYLNLFSDYEKKEYYFSQTEFEKRLVEEFRERGQEICNNNEDDNENQEIDCADNQCGGKVCGRGKSIAQDGNETREIEVDFYCIENECRAREEIQEVVRNVSFVCRELPPIECSEGSKVFFSRYDNETNCPVETSCLEEVESCEVNEDCRQLACGVAECVEKKCKLTELRECIESECTDGDERICESNGEIVEICSNGFWEKTGECAGEPEIREEFLVGNECLSANDCGGGDNVCNNGVCQAIPQVITTPVEEIPSEEQTPNEPSDIELEIEETPSEISPEPQESSQGIITGGIIFGFMRNLFSKISEGNSITGLDIEETQTTQETIPSDEPGTSTEGIIKLEPEINEDGIDKGRNIPNEDGGRINAEGEPVNREGEFEEREFERENEQRREEEKIRCEKECKRPCVEKCIRGECGEELSCVVSEAQKKCEGTCEPENSCVEKCLQGGEWWKEFENKDENKEEKGIFQVGGSCRVGQGKTEGFIWFGGWGEPFEQIQPLKQKYYSGGQSDWCKYDLENLKKQRQEFEQGLNQEFVEWFFEKYLANSADEWEQHVSGIFELYWKDVDLSRQIAERMNCLNMNELPQYNLINIKYETEFGKLEIWEEIKTVKLQGMEKETQVISPYMKAWVFPPKSFIIYEMKRAMENQEFPGAPEEKIEREGEEGPTAEEREMIKQDGEFMEQIRKVTEKYGGNLDAVVRFVDNGDVVFNLYVQVNENDIIKIKPMLPEEVPQEDARIEIEFQKLYDIISLQEKEIRGERIESPPWDRKTQPIQKMKDVVNFAKMYLKIRDMMNSAKVYPETSEEDVKPLMKLFFSMMMKSGGDSGESPEGEFEDIGEEKGIWDEKEKITSEVVFG